ncbi:MAG: phage integrase SAM-like domain-containing protein, partial [Planctomycetes bacterium]|nr:phage integrase SAM-like domain-containing protein [Planctomycetota bacterium]
MASVSYDPKTERRTVQVTGIDGKRRSIRLGRVDKRTAENVKRFIENLAAARTGASTPDMATVEWLTMLPPAVHRRLVKAGLAQPREQEQRPTVAEWVQAFIAARPDVKPRTRINMKQTAKDMTEFFGAARLDEVTPGDAEDFRTYLKSNRKLSEGTTRRQVKRAKQFFAGAVKRRMLAENPFAGIKCGHYADAKRFHFVSRDEAQAVLDGCPDSTWRLIFALVRYAGLRCPSEVMGLTWADVNWERARFAVHASKTADTGADGGTRHVPIFPELLPYLREAFERAEAGQVHVVGAHRLVGENLRTQMMRIIERAGLTVWPKLFVNCRATR